MNIRVLFYIIFLSVLVSCNQDPVPTESDSTAIVSEGDIVVANTASDSVVVLNPDGSYKRVILQLDPSIDSPYGVAWSADTQEILVSVNGSPDRIIAINASSGVTRTLESNGLVGNVRQLGVLSNGDVVIIESNNLERYTIAGARVTSGWPVTNLQNTLEGLRISSSGNIIACSRVDDEVGVYDDDGVVVHAAINSGIGGTTDCYGVEELGNGNIAVSWVGTADTIAIYTSDLTTEVATYSAIEVIGNPRAIAKTVDGTQFYVLDGTYNNIHLFDNDGTYVQEINPGVLSAPNDILVIPSF